MNEFLNYINDFSSLLKIGAVWEGTDEPIAPVLADPDAIADDYIYEFYCYICIVIDLMKNYDISFIKGIGKFEYKFPQKAANKKGKPRFHAAENGVLMFQICAGTKINCTRAIDEDNNPDISFQLANSSDNPSEADIIIIMDAKFKENPEHVLPKAEIYKFITISYSLFQLTAAPTQKIKFNRFIDMGSNCLITNGKAHTGKKKDLSILTLHNIKEVENFAPKTKHLVIG